jgi:hypothetical protein
VMMGASTLGAAIGTAVSSIHVRTCTIIVPKAYTMVSQHTTLYILVLVCYLGIVWNRCSSLSCLQRTHH